MGDQLLAAQNRVWIEPARAEQLPIVLAIYVEAARWLWDRGIHQWNPEEFSSEEFMPLATAGAIWLAWGRDPAGAVERNRTIRASDALATITLTWSDPEVWGPDDGAAGYIHKLAVRRANAGQGIAHQLLRHAEAIIAARGRRYARLDCWAKNDALLRFYTTQGYQLRDMIAEQSWEVARFERQVDAAP